MKGSRSKSFLATLDAYFWKHNKAYDLVDCYICPSQFMKEKLDTVGRFTDKSCVVYNFIEPIEHRTAEKSDYVLQFGHLSREKGTDTLLEVAKRMPETHFVFAGYGSSQGAISNVANAEYVGFKTGDDLSDLVARAKCSVYPSEWYENCPFSVIESQMLLTPVIGSRMGGIQEIMCEGQTGMLFEAGNADDLECKLREMLEPGTLEIYTKNCLGVSFETPETYYNKLVEIYGIK